MADWDTPADQTVQAAPDETAAPEVPVVEAPDNTEKIAAVKGAGWGPKQAYDYEVYGKSSKELSEMLSAQVEESGVNVMDTAMQVGVGGIAVGDWGSNSKVYEWDGDVGDIGPEHPVLEQQLFGSANHVKAGIDFDEVIGAIKVVQEGVVRIQPIMNFDTAGLHPVMRKNVELAGYLKPTPIQQYTLPSIHQNYDIVAVAQTGSGKTAAFLIPILSKLMGKAKKLCAPRPNPAMPLDGMRYRAEPLVLIVCPTRELALQIFDEARRFCYRSMLRPAVVYGGGPLADQLRLLEKGCDVLIGTPGRLVDMINRPEYLTLRRLKYMVIDEADEMVSNDWETELKQIMSGGDQEEGNITYMMFSATFPKMAREMAKQHLAHDHVRIRVGRIGSTNKAIKQDIIFTEPSTKRQCLFDILMSLKPCRTIIFVNSKKTADEIDDFLFNLEFPCTSIHSDRTQKEREDSMRAFRTGTCPILIATGVSARGLDVHNVMHVINYDLPSFSYGGIHEYTHRIGRTARIGNSGVATSFYTSRDEDLAPHLVKLLLENDQDIPDFLDQYRPEGFEAGQEVDIAKIDFEDDSDVEGEEGGNVDADAGGWGAPSTDAPQAAAGGWGASETPAEPTPTPQVGGWGEPAAVPAPQVQAQAPAPQQWAPQVQAQAPAPQQWAPQAAAPPAALHDAQQAMAAMNIQPQAAAQQYAQPPQQFAMPPQQYAQPLQYPPPQQYAQPPQQFARPQQVPMAQPPQQWGVPAAPVAPVAPVQAAPVANNGWGAPAPTPARAAPSASDWNTAPASASQW